MKIDINVKCGDYDLEGNYHSDDFSLSVDDLDELQQEIENLYASRLEHEEFAVEIVMRTQKK